MVITFVHHIPFLNGPAYVSNQHGCVYGLMADVDSDGDVLFYTPQFADGSYSLDENDWIEVDHMALLGEDEDVRLHVEWVHDMLVREYDGLFADPMRMQDTPMADMYGG